jgi:ribosomal protein S18 acetylase RimI-like enzyme
MSPSAAAVRALGPDDAESYVELRTQALLQDPLSFTAGPGDDVASSVDFVRLALADSNQATFGAFVDGAARARAPELAGIVAINRERHRKRAHRAVIWGLYVTPAHRGSGLGRALMTAALAHARSVEGVEYVDLGVGDWNRAAMRLYQDHGFTMWGTEADSLRVGDTVVAEHHMVLRLRA